LYGTYKFFLALLFVCLEDIPQFLIQTTNTLMLGQTLGPIQWISPTVAAICMVLKWSVQGIPDDKKKGILHCRLFTFFVALLPAYIVILAFHDFSGECPAEVFGDEFC